MLALNDNVKHYISGYVDGEGCFSVSFSIRKKFLVGWETKPSFSVSQNKERAQVLHLMKKIFGCGFIRQDRKTLKYEVRSLSDLIEKIIPHFEKYPLLSTKNNDFKYLKQICRLMLNGEHRKAGGLKKITRLAFKMNPDGTRRYSQEYILRTLR
ncbi:MAG: LAGLIDADG family homing endonuclease [Parcubacteria group bacterium]|nr:LAGLIDADG family homing endonuclease [Parcubacteria group bacterium]MBI3074852.1 LAGLIDADG family homing endonuclease [Parcubacteria group bacterium]